MIRHAQLTGRWKVHLKRDDSQFALCGAGLRGRWCLLISAVPASQRCKRCAAAVADLSVIPNPNFTGKRELKVGDTLRINGEDHTIIEVKKETSASEALSIALWP